MNKRELVAILKIWSEENNQRQKERHEQDKGIIDEDLYQKGILNGFVDGLAKGYENAVELIEREG